MVCVELIAPDVSYPGICLLIAAMHSQTSGHDVVTFEMLHDRFYTHMRASSSAPVQVDGGSIGMVKCTREVLMGVRVIFSSLRSIPCSLTHRHSKNWCCPGFSLALRLIRQRLQRNS